MFIILKGLIDKKKVFKYNLIIFIMLLSITIFTTILEYQENLINREYNKEEYRKITITLKENNIDFLDLTTIETINKIENLQYEILFKTRDIKEEFTKNVDLIENIITIEMNSPQSIEANTMAFKIMVTFLIISITLLMLVFSINYIFSIEKDLSLYKLLGFQKRGIIFLILSFLTTISTFTYIVSDILIYICYIILTKLGILENFKHIFKIEIKYIILIIIIFLVSFFINSIILKKKNDFQIINID